MATRPTTSASTSDHSLPAAVATADQPSAPTSVVPAPFKPDQLAWLEAKYPCLCTGLPVAGPVAPGESVAAGAHSPEGTLSSVAGESIC